MKNNSRPEDSNMTEAALAALREQGFSRRQFLKGSGALVVAFSVAEFADKLGISPEKMLAQGGNTPQTLDSWIAIGADGNVTVYTGRADMGQGTFTVQTQLVAEELSVPVNRIRLVECDTAMTPDQGTSSGSQCHPVNFNQENLAQAGATAREALVAMAATRLGASASNLTVVDGVVTHKSDASKKISYGRVDRRQALRDDDSEEREAEAAAAVDDSRPLGAARRHAGACDRALRPRAQRARAGHAARAHGAAAVNRRDARER